MLAWRGLVQWLCTCAIGGRGNLGFRFGKLRPIYFFFLPLDAYLERLEHGLCHGYVADIKF
jgi:hypothetical protein